MTLEGAAIRFLKDFRPIGRCDMGILVKNYADWLLKDCETFKFPVDVDKIITKYNIPIHKEALANQLGFIVEGDPNIYLNASERKSRQTFTFGHEIFEKLFEVMNIHDARWLDFETELKELLDTINSNTKRGKEEKESWCDKGSAHLLMPMEHFKPYIDEYGFSLKTALGIRKMTKKSNELSLESIIRRMLGTKLKEACFVIWHYGYKPSEMSKARNFVLSDDFLDTKPPRKLRVFYSYCNPSIVFIPQHKSIEMNTTVGRAFQNSSNEIVVGYDDFESKSKSLSGRHFVEAMHVALGDDGGVYSLIYLDD